MKARTKLEKRVEQLAQALPKATDEQQLWMLKQIKVDEPHSTEWSGQYATIAQAVEEFQVFRVFLISVTNPESKYGRIYYETETYHTDGTHLRSRLLKHSPNLLYQVDKELYQVWVAPDGKVTIYGRGRLGFSYYWRVRYGWTWEMSIKRDRKEWAYSDDDFYTTTDNVMVESVTDQLKMMFGEQAKDLMLNGDARYYVSAVLSSSYAETLYKIARPIFEEYMKLSHEKQIKYLPAIKVAMRHKYLNGCDFGMWKDLLDLLCKLGKDIHNPYFVCPADLKAMHDKMLKAWRKVEQKRWEEEARLRLMEQVKREKEELKYYDKLIERYGDIRITNSKYQIFVCPSVDAMRLEGEAMHHCVFSCGYYKMYHNCLILLVRDINDVNKRISTMEVSMKDWSIAQNRGYCNENPKDRLNINKLVKKNMQLFIDASKRKIKENKTIALETELSALPQAA